MTPAGRRFRGVLLGVVLVASQVGAWVHEAVVAHVTCLEHGEPLHASSRPARDALAAAASQTAAPVTDSARLGRQPAAAGEGHEHCAGGAFLRARGAALPGPVANGRLSLPSVTPLARDGARPAIVAGRLYLQAPKTSPPSASA